MLPIFVKNRLSELIGLSLIALAVFCAVAFLSYNPADPSFNYVTDSTPTNLAGVPGAYIAGPILEFIGLAGILFVFIPFAWGWKIARKEPIAKLWLRLTMLALCIPALASLSTFVDMIIDVPEQWPAASFGGYIGNFIYNDLSDLIPSWAFGTIAGIVTLATFFAAIHMSATEWGSFFGFFATITSRTAQFFGFFKEKISQLIYTIRYGQEKKVEKPKARKKRKIEVATKKTPVLSRKKQEMQTSLDLKVMGEFDLPSLSLLKPPPKTKKNALSENALSQNAILLEKVLDDFGIHGKVSKVRPGPVVTLYELEPAAGTKSARVIGLADDIARSMSAVSARIAVIPGRNAIGIELPNSTRETVFLRELLESDEYEDSEHALGLSLGKTIEGDPVVVDLAKMPHLLIAGTTGSGKSVGINAMILSLLYKYTPDQCKFIFIDPKMLELSVYDGIPHLLSPVVTEPAKAVVALKWAVKEMENRYRLMSNLGVRNIDGYNERILEAKRKRENLTRTVQTGFNPDTGEPIIEEVPLDMTPLPYIVVVVDEMADLMMIAGKDIESSVQRLSQMARAAGLHIIMATQRPSVDVITGVIKANFPTRISFQVTSRIDSRTILGDQGAEQLLGMGDLLYMAGGSRITRIHGPFVDDKEVEKVVTFLKQQGEPIYIEEVTTSDEEGEFMDGGGATDDLYDQAVSIVCRDRRASTSYIQRCLKIDYNRAATIMDQMERDGIVSPANHAGKREILVETV